MMLVETAVILGFHKELTDILSITSLFSIFRNINVEKKNLFLNITFADALNFCPVMHLPSKIRSKPDLRQGEREERVERVRAVLLLICDFFCDSISRANSR